jgi:hypothetical protein
MNVSSVYLALDGEFTREQILDSFTSKPKKLFIKGQRNSGGKLMKQSLCSFEISDSFEDLYFLLNEKMPYLECLATELFNLRKQLPVSASLQVVARSNGNTLPVIGLTDEMIQLLARAKISFDLDTYIY